MEQLRVLERKRIYLEAYIEQKGDPKGHMMRECAALTWLLEILEQTSLNEELEEARRICAKAAPPCIR